MVIQLIFYQFSLEKIKESINHTSILHFNNSSDLINEVQSRSKTDIIFLTLPSASIGEFIREIHDLRQLDSIFLLLGDSENETTVEQIASKYSKIIGIFSDECHLFQSIDENVSLAIQQIESFKFYEQRQKSTRQLSEEAGAFFWLRLFKQVIFQLPHDDQAKQEMIGKLKECYRNNNQQLKRIDQWNKDYRAEDAIRWYTKEPFIYKQINRALRTEDIELLYKFRYFISDLSKQLHMEFECLRDAFSSEIQFYRGLILSKTEIERFKDNVGKLISTNGYLSTSLSKDVALSYIDPSRNDQEQSVIYEIEYDFAQIDSIIIASIAQYSQHPDEEEILFDLDAVFHIDSVTYDSQSNATIVKMSVSDHGTELVRDHLYEIENDIQQSSAVLVFGRLLGQIGHHEKSEKYFQRLLSNPMNEDPSFIYFYLAASQNYQGRYDKALEYYQQALNLMNQSEKSRTFASSFILNDMGVVHKNLGQYDQALDCLKRCLEIRLNYSKYPLIASSLENLAAIYRVKGDYARALELHRQCLRLREEHLPKEHRQIAKSLGNIGSILMEQGQLTMALEHFQRSLTMCQKTLPGEHEEIALCFTRIAHALTNQGKSRQALDYYQRVLKMKEQLFPQGHLTIAKTLTDIGYVHYSFKEYSTALEYLEKALHLRETQFSSIQDESLVILYTYLGLVKTKLKEHLHALTSYDQALMIGQTIFPPGHTKLTECFTNLGICYRELKDYQKAFDYFAKAAANEDENIMGTNLLNLARTYDNMGICLCYQNDEDQGLEYRLKAVRLISQVTPRANHAVWIDSVGDIFYIRDQYDEALECYLQSLSIRIATQSDDVRSMAENLNNIAITYAAMNKTHPNDRRCAMKARFYFQSALDLYKRIDQTKAVDVLHSLGSMYEHMKLYRTALGYYRDGLHLCQPNISPENIDRETLENSIARMQWYIAS